MLYLLLCDDYTGDYYLHGVFEDKETSYETIERIVSRDVGYKLIKGDIIRSAKPCTDGFGE